MTWSGGGVRFLLVPRRMTWVGATRPLTRSDQNGGSPPIGDIRRTLRRRLCRRKAIRPGTCISIRQPYDPINVVALPHFRLFLMSPGDQSASTRRFHGVRVIATAFRSEAFARGARMLRTALGAAIARYLEDPSIVEVMLNPDGRLWIDRLSGGLEDMGCRVTPADAERIVRLVAHHVGVEVHTGSPRVSAELPESGERFEGLVPPVVRELADRIAPPTKPQVGAPNRPLGARRGDRARSNNQTAAQIQGRVPSALLDAR